MSGFKLTIDGTEYENDKAITIRNTRPENGVSSLELTINDYKSSGYSDTVELFDAVQLELKNKKASYTTTFYGDVYALQPSMSPEVLTVYCRGLEQCLALTHCDESYGVESKNPTIFTPRHIIQDLVDENTQKHFGGNVTWWGLDATDTYVDDIHAGLSVTNLTSKYQSNLTMLNRLSDIVNAYALTLGAPEPGMHWFAYPNSTTPRLYVKEIGDDHTTGNWPKYYGGTQSSATIKQAVDIIDYSFHQSVEHYSNCVVLACNLRKPANEVWTESEAANWGNDGITTISDNAVTYIVGAKSLKIDMNAGSGRLYYPNTENAAWDITKIGGATAVPTINFYFHKDTNCNENACSVRLFTTDHDTDYFYNVFSTWGSDPNDEWVHRSLPIGPYWKTFAESTRTRWVKGTGAVAAPGGAAVWSDINGVAFRITSDPATNTDFYIDDLNIAGKIIRDARDASEIALGNPERQTFLRLDTTIDDTCNTATNTGTAAMLTTSELYKRSQLKTTAANRFLTGTITMPMKEDLLPGQQLYVNAGLKEDSAYRYQLDMRCKEVIHTASINGYITQGKVTSDLWNSQTFGTPSAWGILKESAGALGHDEARDLKASGVDISISRLAWDPTV